MVPKIVLQYPKRPLKPGARFQAFVPCRTCFSRGMRHLSRFLPLFILACSTSLPADDKRVPIPDDIPFVTELDPKMEEPVFAVSSKQGMRILVSRDDGKTWEETFLGTPEREDGGWHGNFAVYGMGYTGGVIGVFSGWGAPGFYLGSDDGKNWGQLRKDAEVELASVWDAAAGNAVFLTSADQWRGMSKSEDFVEWEKIGLRELLGKNGKTHHIIAGYGEFGDGTFIAVGDNLHVFYSNDSAANWNHTMIPEEAGKGQGAVVFGDETFLVSFPKHVARSTDGGKTWELHEHGLEERPSWRGLSFVNGEFWLTGRGGKGGRRSKDGITWEDLPDGTPGGRFTQAESGTIINVERGRNDIRRSEDGKQWETVFTAPDEEDVTWDFAFVVAGKVNRPE